VEAMLDDVETNNVPLEKEEVKISAKIYQPLFDINPDLKQAKKLKYTKPTKDQLLKDQLLINKYNYLLMVLHEQPQ
jgi:hypothetical protein